MPLIQFLTRSVNVRENEVRALFWSFAYFFCLLTAYYILRPLRDEMSIIGGTRNLHWLLTGNFALMLLAVPLFGWVVAKFPRRTFIPLVYRFFILNILIFFALMTFKENDPWIARAFFLWVGVFNLYIVSVFWGFMADIFKSEQGKRLFGFISAGGSAGALLGPIIARTLAEPLGPVNLLLLSAVFLELTQVCFRALINDPALSNADQKPKPIGGSIFAGFTAVARSPYLLGICVYMFLYTSTSTFLWLQQINIIDAHVKEQVARIEIFASLDMIVGALTILAQLFVTGRFMPKLGVGIFIAAVPVFTLAGFLALMVAPHGIFLILFNTLRRAANFALSKPAREVLYTVVTPEQKFKPKVFNDTVAYRGGDAVTGWVHAGLDQGLGFELPALAGVAAAYSAIWVGTSIYLGRKQEQMTEGEDHVRT
jgi:ATP:ADP antiporter, AAA family